MVRKATLEGVESIEFNGDTVEVTFSDVGSIESPEAVRETPRFSEGYSGRDTVTGAPITIENIPRATAGAYFIPEKDQFVDEYNGCSADDQVYHVTYRDGNKTYALPESRIE